MRYPPPEMLEIIRLVEKSISLSAIKISLYINKLYFLALAARPQTFALRHGLPLWPAF